MRKFQLVLPVALALLTSVNAVARDPVTVTVEVPGETGTRGLPSVDTLLNALTNDALRGITPSYTSNTPTLARVDVRGVPALASFAANSPALRVQIPSTGLDRTFSGTTRDDSTQLFRTYIRGSEGAAARDDLLRVAVRSSPIDPIAGGPNSALTQLAVADFARALQGEFGPRSGYGIGARIGSFSAGGYDSFNLTIPADISWRVGERATFSLDAPFSYTSSNGATSYSGNIGGQFQRQMLENWQVQLSARLGAAGSPALGGGSGVYGLGGVSTFRMSLGEGWRLTLINALNYVSTFRSAVGGPVFDYNVANTIFRNGIILARDLPFQLMGFPLSGSAYAVDTRFAGSPVFIRNFQEFGVFVSPGRDSRFGAGFQIMTGDRGLFGFTFSSGVRF